MSGILLDYFAAGVIFGFVFGVIATVVLKLLVRFVRD